VTEKAWAVTPLNKGIDTVRLGWGCLPILLVSGPGLWTISYPDFDFLQYRILTDNK
jgi:hypothetical protein